MLQIFIYSIALSVYQYKIYTSRATSERNQIWAKNELILQEMSEFALSTSSTNHIKEFFFWELDVIWGTIWLQ